jgi:hypothetical protein
MAPGLLPETLAAIIGAHGRSEEDQTHEEANPRTPPTEGAGS